MGSNVRVGRLLKLRTMLLAAASLAMLSVSVPALSAQEVPGITGSPSPSGQPDPAQEPIFEPATEMPVEPLAEPPAETPVETPVEPSVEQPPAGIPPGACDHAAGEFLVGYASEEALSAAPRENVAETFDGILAQHLVFDEIKNIPDPAARLAAEEDKRQELAARPGVTYVEYNCVAEVNQAAGTGESIPVPASCGDCGRSVVEGARKIIAEGFEGAGGKDAFDAALEAARSADEDSVALASEAELDEAGDDQYADDSSGEGDGDVGAEGDGGAGGEDYGETGSGEKAVSGSDGEEAADGEDVSGEDSTGDAGAGSGEAGEEEDSGGPSGASPVSSKNVAASEEPREMSGSGVLALGAGALLLAAGVIVGRRILQG